MFSLPGRKRPEPSTDSPEIVPGFTAPPPTSASAALRELARAQSEVARLRDQHARLADLVAGGLEGYRADRRAIVAVDALLEMRQVLAPAPPLPDDYPVLRPSVPVIPGGLR